MVFAKAPIAGQVKTRLVPPLTPELAAGFYRAMLADVLEESARAAKRYGLEPILAVDSAAALEPMLAEAPSGFSARLQRGPDLGARMSQAFDDLFAEGFGPVLIRGSDSPTVPGRILGEALSALRDGDLAIAPDLDGGYHLIGLSRPAPELFRMAMSHEGVLQSTLRRAREAGLEVECLETGADIDVVADVAQLRDPDCQPQARRSEAFATRHDLWRFLDGGSAQTSRRR